MGGSNLKREQVMVYKTHRKLATAIVLFLTMTLGPIALVQEKPAHAERAEDTVTKAYTMRMEGNLDGAERMLEQELEKHPQNAEAWLELARLEFHKFGKSGDLASAQSAIGKAVAAAPEDPSCHRWASRIAMYYAIHKSHHNDHKAIPEQLKMATKAAEQAVKLDPDDHEARRILVSLYGNNPPHLGGDQGRAERHVKILEERSSVDGASARCELSLKRRTEEKIALWNSVAEELGKDDPRVHEHLARQYAWSGDVKLATVHAEKALELDPSRGRVLVELARAFALEKKLAAAERFAQRYLDFDPPGPRAVRAWTHMALGRIQKCEETTRPQWCRSKRRRLSIRTVGSL